MQRLIHVRLIHVYTCPSEGSTTTNTYMYIVVQVVMVISGLDLYVDVHVDVYVQYMAEILKCSMNTE